MLCAGRYLARAGFPSLLYRAADRPLPRGVDGPWRWPPHRRVSRLAPRAPRALTVSPAWGISAAPRSDEPFGRPGPWATEAAEIEQAYGPERTVHLSLEEFARTLTPLEETVERLREGGVPSREVPARLRAARSAREIDAYRAAFRRYRAFDRSNVLSLFAALRYAPAFGREFPEAVQVGPLWPVDRAAARRPPRVGRRWLWYASPASAEAIAPAVFEGLQRAGGGRRLVVRSTRAWSTVRLPATVDFHTQALRWAAWERAFREAELRIVTGSRSLLAALAVGGPFLYFNGVLGTGAARRRHRPEKIVALLGLARSAGWPRDLVADLADFSRGRRVASVVSRAASQVGSWSTFPSAPEPAGFAPGFEDAGRLIVCLAEELEASTAPASDLVASVRRRSNA